MLTSEFITTLGLRLGNRDDLDTVILDTMNDVKESVLEKQGWFPWFLEIDTNDTDSNLTTVVGSELVALPADYLGQVEETSVWLLDSDGDWQELKKAFYADMLRLLAVDAEVVAYNLRGTTMRVRGIPTTASEIRMQYYKSDSAFVLGETNLWLTNARAVVFAEVGRVVAAKNIRDAELAASFEQDALRAWSLLKNEHTARMEAGASWCKGDD